MLYAESGSGRQSLFPSYFFSDTIQEWVIFHVDAASRSYVIPTQLVLKRTQELTLITQESEAKHKKITDDILVTIHTMTLGRDIRPSLPIDFATRILVLKNDAAVIVARTEEEAERVAKAALELKVRTQTKNHLQLSNTGREQYHFQWSNRNWARFCAKTALEALCLFEGGNKCLGPEFALVRDFVIEGSLASGRELIFTRQGPKNAADVPPEVHVDLTADHAAPEIVSCVVPRCEAGSHAVVLHEIRGWILASVVFAGLPATTLVLAGPSAHLNDFYQMFYDKQEEEYHFLRLAYDEAEPVIPVAVPGNRFDEIAETYKLKAI